MRPIEELEHQVILDRIQLRKSIEELTERKGEAFIFWSPHPTARQAKFARILPDRFAGIRRMPKNGVCIEVGTQTGLFAREILDINKPKEFHVIDVDYSTFHYDLFEKEINSGMMTIHEGPSQDILNSFPDDYFDWVYIDADHAYDGVVGDINASKSKLKQKGFLVFNDYTVWSPAEVSPYGILQAVNEFLASPTESWEIDFLALQGQGYHDICLRRMPKGFFDIIGRRIENLFR